MTAPDRWTEQTAELVAQAEYRIDMAAEESDDFEPIEWRQALPSVTEAYLARVRVGLDAMADAALLLPPGGQTREDYEVRSGHVTYPCSDLDRARRQYGGLLNRGQPAKIWQRTVTTWPDGTTLTGPWTAVEDNDG